MAEVECTNAPTAAQRVAEAVAAGQTNPRYLRWLECGGEPGKLWAFMGWISTNLARLRKANGVPSHGYVSAADIDAWLQERGAEVPAMQR